MLKKIVAIKETLESLHQTEYRTWNGLWPPPASKENPAPEYNCNATTRIVNLSQATPAKCLANVITHNSFVRKANVM